MEALAQALLIFVLRVVGIAISTLATILTVQGRKLLAVLSGSLSTLIYVVAIAQVVTNLRNLPNLAAYVVGFGVGTWVGMVMEERIALGYSEVRVISSSRGVHRRRPSPGWLWSDPVVRIWAGRIGGHPGCLRPSQERPSRPAGRWKKWTHRPSSPSLERESYGARTGGRLNASGEVSVCFRSVMNFPAVGPLL